MAGRIQGITVEIGGDTTKLQTALKGVNAEIRNTQSQLKDVDKFLKLDPGNTELLAQKHKLLAQAVTETKEKLETLKTAAAQADEALKNGAITQEQYDGLQREIAETEAKLKSLEGQANQSATALQKIASDGEKLKTMGENVTEVGKKFLPVTGIVTGLGTAAVKTAADFDEGMSRVSAISGATGDELQTLRDKAREMGAKTKFSASEAASAFEYMAMAGWKSGEMIDGIDGIMSLAAASGEDLAVASDIVTDALTAFGLEASDAGHFSDILAAASSNANTNVSMMGETFKYCAPIAGALGFSAEDTAEAIGLMANSGIKGSQAGTSLRTVMNNLSGDIKITGRELGNVTIHTTNADGSMRGLSDILADCRAAFSKLSESEKANAAESLVGKNAMSGFLALMNAGENDIAKLSNAIANCDGTAESMANTMQDNLAGQLTILKSQLEELAISFGEMLMPAIRSIVGWVQNFVDWLNSMDEGTRKVIITIALVAAAIGPVLIIVGKVMSAVGTIMTIIPKLAGVIKTVKTAFAALNTTMLANPIVLIIAAIAALVAAFIYLWNTNEDFRQFWIDLWENIKRVAIDVWNAIKDFFAKAWTAIRSTAETVWNGIRDFFSGLWNGIKTIFTTVLGAIKTVISMYFTAYFTIIRTIWNGIRTVVTTVMNAITAFLTAAWNAIKSTIQTVLTAIRSVISTVWNAIKTVFETVFKAIKTAVTTYFNVYKTIIVTVLNAIKTVVTTVWNAIKTAVTTVVSGMKTAITTAWNAIKNTTSTVFNAVKSVVTSVWNGIKSSVMNVVNSIKSGISNGFNAIKSTVSNIVNGIKNTISNVFNTIWSTVSGIVNKLKSVFSFKWSLPKIKLPHFSIKGSFSLNPPSIPHFSVDWYKKAMSGGMILKDATIFGQSGGTLLGGGEAGDEAVVGVASLRSMIQDAVQGAALSLSGDQPLINIQEMSVRSDDDIRKISQQLNTLLTAGRRAKGYI